MTPKDFWYVVAESRQLRRKRPLSRMVLGEWLVLFRDKEMNPVVLQDQCLHRSAQLSKGRVRDGCIQCPYHGWTYNGEGRVVRIPSEGDGPPRIGSKLARRYPVREVDGYIYVCLSEQCNGEPFRITHHGEPGWHTLRLIHRFDNTVTNCVENFVDIPHTLSVHPGIFRVKRNQKIAATIERRDGSVIVSYENETDNLGLFSRFLNPSGGKISHTDAFYMPNVTRVEYDMGNSRKFVITSQSVPLTAESTIVYTDLTYNYGVWSAIARPFIWLQAKVIIAQDIAILRNQMETIRRYGGKFHNSPADLIHTMIESIRYAIESGKDPRLLSPKVKIIEFWI